MTRSSFAVLSAAIATAMTLGVAAEAKPDGRHGGMHPSFETLDQNKDGQVNRSEMESAAKSRFAEVDRDDDGFLTKDEITAHVDQEMTKRAQKRQKKMFSRFDDNDDGKISFEEMGPMRKRLDKMFSRVDKDNSGALSKDEFDAAKQKMRKRHGHEHRYMKPQDDS